MVTGATPGRAAARAGSREALGLPDPDDSWAGPWRCGRNYSSLVIRALGGCRAIETFRRRKAGTSNHSPSDREKGNVARILCHVRSRSEGRLDVYQQYLE